MCPKGTFEVKGASSFAQPQDSQSRDREDRENREDREDRDREDRVPTASARPLRDKLSMN